MNEPNLIVSLLGIVSLITLLEALGLLLSWRSSVHTRRLMTEYRDEFEMLRTHVRGCVTRDQLPAAAEQYLAPYAEDLKREGLMVARQLDAVALEARRVADHQDRLTRLAGAISAAMDKETKSQDEMRQALGYAADQLKARLDAIDADSRMLVETELRRLQERIPDAGS